MANLKAIRDRIKSVKNTRKITEAMRLVAAAKVRRAQDQVNASRPFADRLAQVFYRLQTRLRMEEVDLPLLAVRPIKRVALLVVSGDRGLCGGYNTYVIKKAEERLAELAAEGVEVDMYVIGRKASQYFKRRERAIAKAYINLNQVPSLEDAAPIASTLLNMFTVGTVDRVELVFTRFVSLLSSRPAVQTLLPLDLTAITSGQDEAFRVLVKDGKFTVDRDAAMASLKEAPRDMIFEQEPVQILNALLPLYFENQLLRALQESAASELASRMSAMSNASDNAKELIAVLNLGYNKARQAAITQEILEVVGGANAT